MAPQTGQKRPHADSARQGKTAPGKKTFGGNSSYNKGGARPVKTWPSKSGGGGGGGSDRAAGAGAGGDKGKGKWQWPAKPPAPRGGGGGGGGAGGAEAKFQRKRPITAPALPAGADEDEDEDEDVSMSSDEAGEGEGVGGYANPNPDVANDAGGDEPGEKRPRLSKAEKAALHAAQPHRVTLLPSHALLQELLPLWERARRAEMEKEERRVAIKELYEGVKGRVLEVGRGHKGGRILQTIVKYGGKDERLGVAMELRPQWRAMMESKYSKFLMSKLIRYCPPIRPLLITDLTTCLPALLAHAEAVQPLSDFFDLYATAREKRQLVRGFYPKEVRIFDGEGGKEGELDMAETLDKMGEGAQRARVLEGVEKNVLSPFNATQKTALAQGIFHRLVHEYLMCLYRFLDAEAADTKMHELLTTSLESLPEIVHTKDGSAVVQLLIARGNAKDRKQILQHLRKHIPAMAKDAEAQTVLFTAFDCVDDTKLMGKAFVADLVALAPELAADKNGRRALLYLLTPESSKHFLISTVRDLKTVADLAREVGTSKKDPVVRRKELVGYASAGLIGVVAEKGAEMVRDPGSGLAVQEIMLHAEGDKSGAIASLTAPLRIAFPEEPTAESESTSAHPFELSHAVRTYKLLLSGGQFNAATKSIDVVDPKLPAQFAAAVWEALASSEAGGSANAVRAAAAAPFVLVEMLAALTGGELAEAKKVLGAKGAREVIGQSEAKGAGLLLERLA